MKRWAFITLIGGLVIAWPLASYAQQPKQPQKRVGGLAPIPCPLQPDNLAVRRLAELGWIEGQNIVFDCVSTVGRVDQVSALALELVSRHPDVLVVPFEGVDAGHLDASRNIENLDLLLGQLAYGSGFGNRVTPRSYVAS